MGKYCFRDEAVKPLDLLKVTLEIWIPKIERLIL
jgi:hypothetical protein